MPEQLEKSKEELWKEVEDTKKRLLEALRREQAPVEHDYVFEGWNGLVKLSELFGDKKDLIVIHNMGERCSYCTLWADGFNGVLGHLTLRAAFVVMSPDEVETQKQFAGMRSWKFTMCSVAGSSFTKDMGFEPTPGAYWPGLTTFHKDDDGTIHKVGSTFFGPGDDFCPTWPMFDLLADGPNGWEPENSYHPGTPAG